MGRQPRPIADGLVYHALNRGNNRGAVFADAGDCQAFLDALAKTKERYPIRLGQSFGLIDGAQVWERLGKTAAARQRRWRQRVHRSG